jgi:hypothetical protein
MLEVQKCPAICIQPSLSDAYLIGHRLTELQFVAHEKSRCPGIQTVIKLLTEKSAL